MAGSGTCAIDAGTAGTPDQASRAHGIGAREKYSARPRLSHTTFTTFGLNTSATSSSGCAAVAIAQSGWAARYSATSSIRFGSISGSSPCTLTTMSSSARPSRVATSARRSVPDGWSARVITASTPCAAQASATAAASVATTVRRADEAWARSATRTIIGCPPISASGLFGRRVEASRAGITTVKAGMLIAGKLSCQRPGRTAPRAPRGPARSGALHRPA
ncbi:hypothetical protein D3C72_965960 [compost metagenome]